MKIFGKNRLFEDHDKVTVFHLNSHLNSHLNRTF